VALPTGGLATRLCRACTLKRRAGQGAAGLTAQYVYDMLNVAQEQYTGGTVADMLPGLGLDQNFARTDPSGTSAMLSDLLGSTVGLVNSAGALATGYQYGPFGQTTSGASSTNPFQYTGREMDPTGLYFLRARYYNPIAQRFISPDPIGLVGGQANLYAYVGNSPVNWTDPLGLISSSVGATVGESYTCVAFCGQDGAPPPAIEALPSNGMNSASGYFQVQLVLSTQRPTPSASPTPGSTVIITPPTFWDWLRYYFNRFVGYDPNNPPEFWDPGATRGSLDIPAPAAPTG